MVIRNTDAVKEWTGQIVCTECYEPRHTQDFVRGKKDNPSARGLVHVETSDSLGRTGQQSETGCAYAGVDTQYIG